MPVTKNTPAPYAPSGAILTLIARHRSKGLPSPIDADVLSRAGISDSLNSRTLYALQVLDLIDGQGRPTPIFEGLRLAPESEYKKRLSDWLASAYEDALKFVDPAIADEVQIRDAFRGYSPTGQQDRMVSLFLGLFEAAGVAPDRKRQRSKPVSRNGESVKRPKPASLSVTLAPEESPQPNSPSSTADVQRQTEQIIDSPSTKPVHRHPFIEGLLATLPNQGENWPSKDRVKWLVLAANAFDLIYKGGNDIIEIKTTPDQKPGAV